MVNHLYFLKNESKKKKKIGWRKAEGFMPGL